MAPIVNGFSAARAQSIDLGTKLGGGEYRAAVSSYAAFNLASNANTSITQGSLASRSVAALAGAAANYLHPSAAGRGQTAAPFLETVATLPIGLAASRAGAAARPAAASGSAGATTSLTPKVTPKGITRVEQHLAQFGENAPNQAMVDRLRSGATTPHDVAFYMHELKESAIMSRTRNAFTDVYEWQRAAHLETLEWQHIPYAPGYESQLYHPSVISKYPDHFNPAAWPK